MKASSFVRAVVLGTAALILAACSNDVGAAKLKKIKDDATRDAALAEMGKGAMTATGQDTIRLVNGFRRQLFTAEGTQHEVIWYREEPGHLETAILKTTDTPVVIANGKFAGWGWRFYNKYSEQYKLPNPAREKAIIDSISSAQSVKKP